MPTPKLRSWACWPIPAPEVRREAARGLKGRASRPAQSALVAALTDSDPTVRVAAAEGLAASGSWVRTQAPGTPSPESVTALIRALGDAQADARAAAASALGVLLSPPYARAAGGALRPDESAAPDKMASGPVAAALDDEAPQVRLAAARALAAMAGAHAVAALLAKLHDPAPEVRIGVFELLAKLAPNQTEPLLMQALDDPGSSLQLELLRVLASMPGPKQAETVARLEALIRKGRPQLAAAAQMLLHPPVVGAPQGALRQGMADSSSDWVALLEPPIAKIPGPSMICWLHSNAHCRKAKPWPWIRWCSGSLVHRAGYAVASRR